MYDKVFGGMVLPVKPAMMVTGASIRLVQDEVKPLEKEAFFGGYAEDMLSDIGFEMVDDQPQPEMKAKRV